MKNKINPSLENLFSVIGATTFLLAADLAYAPGPSPVPEPGPIGLLVLGFVALVCARRFRKNR